MTVDTITTGRQLAATDPLAGWLEAASDAQTLAQGLVRSFFVPAAYKPNPREEGAYEVAVANATGAILLGRSLGLDPLTSLQQIYVVHGRPGMYTKLKVALAQAAGHRVWDEVYSPERAVVCGQRKGTEDVVRIEITIEDAERAGWIASNPTYKKTPADMLWARAAARVVDRIAADLLMGVRSIEDIDADDEPATAVTTSVRSERPRAALALAQSVPAQQEPSEPITPTAADHDDSGAPVSERVWAQINSRLNAIGVNGPGKAANRLQVIGQVIGRTIAKGSELTAVEAQLVLDSLAGEAGVRLAGDVLGWAAQADAEAAVAEGYAQDEAEQLAAGEHDPTLDDDWGMDGAEAAAEGM